MEPDDDLLEFVEIVPGFYATEAFMEKPMKHPMIVEEGEKRAKELFRKEEE